MNSATSPPNTQYPIRVVARRTGLTPDLIRTWEKRYNAVSPKRSDTGRRIYLEADVDKLLLLQSALAGGRRIGDVAGLQAKELRELIRQDQAAVVPPPAKTSTDLSLTPFLQAVMELDAAGLEAALAGAAARHGADQFMEAVAAPLLREVGELWIKGSLSPFHEHFATEMVKQALQEIMHSVPGQEGDPVLVVATPAGQHHEMGALMAGASAAVRGWRVLYLGANLPAADIAAAAKRGGAKAVALSMVYPKHDPELKRDLRSLVLPPDTALIVGGSAAPSYGKELRALGAKVIADARSFGEALAGLVGKPSA